MSVESGTTELLGIESEAIQSLMRRSGYPLKQENGQRRYGPPPDWNGPPPGRGCEVFVGKLPRDCFENELVPVFERFGRIYEVCVRVVNAKREDIKLTESLTSMFKTFFLRLPPIM